MAGSYEHAVNDDGSLRDPGDLFREGVENLGDAYEVVEELYGMVWFLARQLELPMPPRMSKESWVDLAKKNYSRGVELSPTDRPAMY